MLSISVSAFLILEKAIGIFCITQSALWLTLGWVVPPAVLRRVTLWKCAHNAGCPKSCLKAIVPALADGQIHQNSMPSILLLMVWKILAVPAMRLTIAPQPKLALTIQGKTGHHIIARLDLHCHLFLQHLNLQRHCPHFFQQQFKLQRPFL